MRLTLKSLCIVLFTALLGCGKTQEKPLYDQVMDIHDEVMPKMGDIYKLKKSFRDSIANTADMTEEKKAEIEQLIQQLDSANSSMMVWMREFNPPDQKDKEAFQKYMESELVKVKKMREDVYKALEAAKDNS